MNDEVVIAFASGGWVNIRIHGLQWLLCVSSLKIQTKAIHAGEPRPRIAGAIVMPVFQTAMYEYAGEKTYDDVRYIRLNNTPNAIALGEKLADLENAEAALVTSSGMSAITTTLLTLLSKGDHLLAQDCLYGGTHDFVTKDLEKFGIEYDLVDGNDPNTWEKRLRPNTKAIYVETISNPLVQVPDLEAVVKFSKAHNLVSAIDNTFTSPVNYRPPEHGFDISIHSATKYLNGHSDLVAGAVIGKEALIEKITHRLNHLGGSLDPHAAFLLHRGMKTLALRVRQHNANAMKVASFLESHGAIAKVNYPGLSSHPQHQRASRLFEGCGGMMSFEMVDGVKAAESFMHATKLAAVAPSLGGIETLITRPATTSHSGLSPLDRQKLAITDGLIRLSVGLEDADDLIEDFGQALSHVAKPTGTTHVSEKLQVTS